MFYRRMLFLVFAASLLNKSAIAAENRCVKAINQSGVEAPAKSEKSFFRAFIKNVLKIRYDIKVSGIEEVAAKGTKSTLFLFNHPGFVDPVIVNSVLAEDFQVRPVMDAGQLKKGALGKVIGSASEKVRTILMPEVGNGVRSKVNIKRALDEIVDGLIAGDNILLYPAGQLARSAREEIGSKSAVEYVLKAYKERTGQELRVVLGKTSGLWGSSFGWGQTGMLDLIKAAGKATMWIFLNGIFFVPKRDVRIDLVEPTDMPKDQDRLTINRYLEKFYEPEQHNIQVPYHFLGRLVGKKTHEVENPKIIDSKGGPVETKPLPEIDPAIIAKVLGMINQIGGVESDLMTPEMRLTDVGIDSVSIMELTSFLEETFNQSVPDGSLVTIADALKIAAGLVKVDAKEKDEKKASKDWEKNYGKGHALEQVAGKNVGEKFLNQAKKHPGKVIAEDEVSGPVTYRKAMIGTTLFKSFVEKIPAEKVGIMLPPSAGNMIVYLATIFSGKIPVMVNYTAGGPVIKSSLERAGVTHVITSGMFVDRLAREGYKFPEIEDKLYFTEDIKEKIGKLDQIKAALTASKKLDPSKIKETAVILFTSGSSSEPKIVPLSHENLMANVQGVASSFKLTDQDSIMAFLPAFHSFGNFLMTLSITQGIPAVYYANAKDGRGIGELIGAYKPTIAMGTPTFVNNIYSRTIADKLKSLRYVIMGAEKMPEPLRQLIIETNPNTLPLEGYGATETSPVLAVNTEEYNKPGTVGRLLPGLEGEILDPETMKPVPVEADGSRYGLLIVKGDSVFEGYLNAKAEDNPFVTTDGEDKWYNTGDLVRIDKDGFITIVDRLSRSIKVAGEMVSLGGIEKALEEHFAELREESDEGPIYAVESAGNNEQVVLFTTKSVDFPKINQILDFKGFKKISQLNRVVQVTHIPVLGTGKNDYKLFRKFLKAEKEDANVKVEDFIGSAP